MEQRGDGAGLMVLAAGLGLGVFWTVFLASGSAVAGLAASWSLVLAAAFGLAFAGSDWDEMSDPDDGGKGLDV